MNRAEHKALAEERIGILWEYYKKHGEISTLKVKELTGGATSRTLHFAAVKYELEDLPPIYDSKKEIRRRQIKLLWDVARELGRDWLTSQEAAAALGFQPKNIFSTDRRLKGEIPEIRYKRHLKGQRKKPELTHIPDEPYSLEYYRSEPGPGPNQITYFLK